MHRTLYDPDFISSIFNKLRFLGSNFEENVPLWLSYYMFCFVTYHEVGHIIRGHSGYQIDALKGPKRYYEISGLKQSAYDRAYYLCECDADAVGGQAVGDQLKEKANELSDRLHIPYSKCLLDLTLLATASIYIFFLILDLQYKGPSPHSGPFSSNLTTQNTDPNQ